MNKRYGDRVIFNDFSLTVNAGEMICICCASGSGKSTLLNIIGMFEKADSGEVRLFGERIPDSVYQAADWRLASRAAAVSSLRSKEDGSANLTQDPK